MQSQNHPEFLEKLACPGWTPDPNFRLIRLSRPKLSLIRLCRRKLTLFRLSRPKIPLIRLSRHKRSLIRLFRPKAFWSDHGPESNSDHCPDVNQTMIRLKCARRGYDQTQLHSKHLWSDPIALAAIYDQTEARWKPVLIRLKCAQKRLIRERFYLCFFLFIGVQLTINEVCH